MKVCGEATQRGEGQEREKPRQSCTVGFEDIEWVVDMGSMDWPPHSMETLQDWNQSLALFLGYEGTVVGAENIRVLWTTPRSSPAPAPPRVREVVVANSTGTRFFEVATTQESDETAAALEHYLSWRATPASERAAARAKRWVVAVAPNVFVATHEFLRFLACFDARQATALVALRNRTHTDTDFVALTQPAAHTLGRAASTRRLPTGRAPEEPWCRGAGVALRDVGLVVSDRPPDAWLGAHAADQIARGLRGPVVYTHVPLPHQLDYFPYYVNFERGRHPRSFVYPPTSSSSVSQEKREE